MSDTADFDRTDRPSTAQPPPVHVPGEPSAHDLVIADMAERKAYGLRKYGTLLQLGNGRDHLEDVYEELLDAAAYIRLELERRRRTHYEVTPTVPSAEYLITRTFTG